MGHQIVKQPDGNLAVWSTVVDDWVIRDATAEQLADYYAERAALQAAEEVLRVTEAVLEDKATDIYHQFTRTFEELEALRAKTETETGNG